MDKQGLIELSDYTEYANGLVLDVARKMTPEELERSSSPSHGSVLGLLRHMFGCEAFFLARCQGNPPGPAERGDALSFEELIDAWRGVAEERKAYLAATSEADLAGGAEMRVGGQRLGFTRAQMLVQSLVHSIHHRGELSIVMTGLGYPLPTLDIILHFNRQSGREWPGK